MLKKDEYREYFGVSTAPCNFERLEYLALNELKSIMIGNIPTSNDLVYNDFKKALMEQINYLDLNSDLIDSAGSGGYTLGSYSEGSFNQSGTSKSINRISPVAYDILLNCGLLYSGLKGRC